MKRNIKATNFTLLCIGICFLLILFFGCLKNKTEDSSPVQFAPQPLAGIDELGRILPLNDSVGNPKSNRQVGIFYFLWQGDGTAEIHWDLSEIIPNHPEVLEDYDNPNWGLPVYHKGGRVGMYFWGKPIYGYYRGDDYWVHLRSMQLLTDAGVDFVVIDATNGPIYQAQSEALMRAMDDIRKQGKNSPKIVYYTNTRSGETMQKIYDTYYKPEAPNYHPDCWYYLDGKPLILGISAEAEGHDYQEFFTFRESQWPTESQKENGWPWISFTRPQKVHYNKKGEAEIVNLSVCQHPNPGAGMGGAAFYGNMDNWGRSYRNGSHGTPEEDIFYGYNFQEQWDYALSQDVPFIFITGWNEWVAGRWDSKDGNPEHSWFCDQASPEYSRDIEPTRTAGLNDNYYMQMVANIRRYKGMVPFPNPGKQKTIKSFGDWDEVLPVYTDYTGDTQARNHPGAESNPKKMYINKTGRNDFYLMKMTNDKRNIFFFVQTQEDITAQNGSNWMNLYIDCDRNARTGWSGYDFRISEGNKLQKYTNKEWKTIAEITSHLEKDKLMYTIPLKNLGITSQPNIEFKWSDNMQDDTDPLDWYVNGDAAPGGRFNFIYTRK